MRPLAWPGDGDLHMCDGACSWRSGFVRIPPSRAGCAHSRGHGEVAHDNLREFPVTPAGGHHGAPLSYGRRRGRRRCAKALPGFGCAAGDAYWVTQWNLVRAARQGERYPPKVARSCQQAHHPQALAQQARTPRPCGTPRGHVDLLVKAFKL